MHILFIVPYAPTLIRVRPHDLIKSLVGRGHRLTLATMWTDGAERQALAVRVAGEALSRWRECSLLHMFVVVYTGVHLLSYTDPLSAACGCGGVSQDGQVAPPRGPGSAVELRIGDDMTTMYDRPCELVPLVSAAAGNSHLDEYGCRL